MNEKGHGALVKAGLDGVPQAFGKIMDGEKRCAFGVLGDSLGVPLTTNTSISDREMDPVFDEYDISAGSPRQCPECGEELTSECSLIIHLNDTHKFDFLTIARKLA